jgi:hypothetical protein
VDIQNTFSNLVNQYVVRATGGKNTTGVNGFIFDILGDEDWTLDSEITDHYVEENYAVQDHVALRPPKFTLKGYMGELTNLSNSPLFSAELSTIQGVATSGLFSPSFSTQANQVYNQITQVISGVTTVVNQVSNAYQVFAGQSTTATKQQAAYSFFLNSWLDRMSCSVETPWGVFHNMYIEQVNVLQKDGNRYVSEFSVTFKQIRKVTTVVEPAQSQSSFTTQGLQTQPEFNESIMDKVSPVIGLGITSGSSTDIGDILHN